jgi:hypothetical protein
VLPRHRSIRLAVLAAVAAGPLAAQTPGAPLASPPRFEAEVAVVALPVFVTDKQGQPVSGLTAADFEAGDYTFRVRVKDPLSAEPADSAQAVRIN